MIAWLKSAWALVAGLWGFLKAGFQGTGAVATSKVDALTRELATCRETQQREVARLTASIEEARRERDEWRTKAMAALPPGERLNAGVDAARSVLSRAGERPPAVRPVPPVLAPDPARRKG